MFVSSEAFEFQVNQSNSPVRNDPRIEMAVRLPATVQPFITWLTAKPEPGKDAPTRSPRIYVAAALALTFGGIALSSLAMLGAAILGLGELPLLALGLIVTTSGLGLFQVGIFHHCAHNTVFSTPKRNRSVGRMISALLLFKYFDSYKHEHMLHHNPKILFTTEDEFSDFVVNICNLSSGMTRVDLWRRLALMLVSPIFHSQFLYRRICGSLRSENRRHNMLGIVAWTGTFAFCVLTHTVLIFVVALVLPVSVLLQIATVFRILCEHRVPDIEIIKRGGQALVCQATAGVFAGANVPAADLPFGRAMLAWAVWWANMLTVQLFVRVFVLVGDAPCHDFHHRRPARPWTNYINARQGDLNDGCPGFPVNYVETWGLFKAVDENFAALARAPADLMC